MELFEGVQGIFFLLGQLLDLLLEVGMGEEVVLGVFEVDFELDMGLGLGLDWFFLLLGVTGASAVA